MVRYIAEHEMRRAVRGLREFGAVCLQKVISEAEREDLLAELSKYRFRKAPRRLGPYKTKQEFRSFRAFPKNSLFARKGWEIEREIRDRLQSINARVLEQESFFTELIAQIYEPCEVGIAPHRDRAKFINLIAIVVLEGKGRFCICASRSGAKATEIIQKPGDMILIRGSDFDGEDKRPFHFVDRITERRIIFTLRQEKK